MTPRARLWAIEYPSTSRVYGHPPLVLWDAPDAQDILDAYRNSGWTVRGPYVLEVEALCPEPCCVERRERADAWAMLTELYRVLVRTGAGSSEKRHRYGRTQA